MLLSSKSWINTVGLKVIVSFIVQVFEGAFSSCCLVRLACWIYSTVYPVIWGSLSIHLPVQSEGTSLKVFIGNLQTKHISAYRDLQGFSRLQFRAGSPHAMSCRSFQLPPHSSLVPLKKLCSADLSAIPESSGICLSHITSGIFPFLFTAKCWISI